MKIIDKIKFKQENRNTAPAVTIAFLGDSITEGVFEVYMDKNDELKICVDSEAVYHNKVKKIFSKLYPTVPINIINAGISGESCWDAIKRLENDVIRHNPDLCVVAFGGNDAMTDGGIHVDKFYSTLKEIFSKLQEKDIEIILMTKQMNCTKVSNFLTHPELIKIAGDVAEIQNSGRLSIFMEAAKKAAREMNVPICDCYSKWQKLYESGVDTDSLLINHINHPDKDMHWLYAISLAETMFNEI